MTTYSTDNNVVNHVYLLLKYTFGILPIVAGLDKFTNLLTDWSQYLSPTIANMLPFSPEVFMMIVGVIEIAVGVVILTRFTMYGAYIASAWLVLIAINLIMHGYIDVAVRDLVMAIAAFSLAQLASVRQPVQQATPSAAQRETHRPVHA